MDAKGRLPAGVASLADLIPIAAERNPDGIAVADRGTTITWSDADARAGRLAAALAESGVTAGDRVGVHHRKCTDGFLAMHAVVRRGGIAVPLDPTASGSYLGSVVERTGCEVLVTHDDCRRTATSLVDSGALRAVIGLDALDAPAGVVALDPTTVDRLDPLGPAGTRPDDPAYLITTSGSTATPKSICHTHASALAYVGFKLAAYDFGPDDRISDLAPNHFDISTQALWVTPAVGATNVVIPDQHQILPASLSQLMADERLTVWYGVPYLLTQLVSRGSLAERDLSHLRWVLFGGEVLAPQVLADLMRQLPGARFSNVYGPAEVNACTVHHLDELPTGEEPVPIGGPVADTAVRVVDPDLGVTPRQGAPAEVGPGEQGELWVSAPTMMQGYWNLPELTSRSVVDWDGKRWYQTGDLGYQRADGALVFSGRVDHQVKIRGYRVELESVESILEDLDGVANAVVAVARSTDGGDVLIAGILPEPGSEVDHEALRRWADSRLPAYAVPTRFSPIGSVAVTGSGKLDRREIRSNLVDAHHGEGDI